MPSERFVQLRDQLAALRSHLLPEAFDPTGLYEQPDAISTRALGYRVLAHAEIETYFEDRALEVANLAREAWERTRFASRVALCLTSFSGKEMRSPPDTLQAPSDNKKKTWPELIDINVRLTPIWAAFHHFVRSDNNGVKEKNLLALLLPIGIDHGKLDPNLLADLDSFGALRGAAAHSSSRTGVRQALNPADELRRVESLLVGIEPLDAEIDALLLEIPKAPRAIA
ncbi:hypothetical protein QLQ15_17860 [Lysobacter sp. LF1]|uniref:RiboL-PSP-HEPN domain-containing protein n=1 Tax=Lysobacter stagni TaxID=3045172 RepID=A0ABT6XL41_9GAMM|nr:hypothetical protein [Lysobacter sp. LF1]MDI9240773.1 hypothetical protein [Lysobacter sp. LF1]